MRDGVFASQCGTLCFAIGTRRLRVQVVLPADVRSEPAAHPLPTYPRAIKPSTAHKKGRTSYVRPKSV